MDEISFDWVWVGDLRQRWLALSDDDADALAWRIANVSRSPWPDWNVKQFVEMEFVRHLEGGPLIIYADDDWAIVYEVVQPFVFAIYHFGKM